jgi:hypothetical protein
MPKLSANAAVQRAVLNPANMELIVNSRMYRSSEAGFIRRSLTIHTASSPSFCSAFSQDDIDAALEAGTATLPASAAFKTI